jgi:hypothetical protein
MEVSVQCLQPTFVTESSSEAASQEPQTAVIPSSAKEHKLYQKGREAARKSIVSSSRGGSLPGVLEESEVYGDDFSESGQHYNGENE